MTSYLLRISQQKLAEIRSDPSLLGTLVMDTIQGNAETGDFLDLYKSWNALHVLLQDGEFGAEADAVMGGSPIGEDLGYGPARVLDHQEVAKISDAFDAISQSDFESRFDVSKMEGVYSFHAENADDEWENISDLFEELKTFYATAAKETCGMVLFLV